MNKILNQLKQFKLTDDKLTIVQKNFSGSSYESLNNKEKSKLSDTAKDLFHFISQFPSYHNVKDNVQMDLLEVCIHGSFVRLYTKYRK